MTSQKPLVCNYHIYAHIYTLSVISSTKVHPPSVSCNSRWYPRVIVTLLPSVCCVKKPSVLFTYNCTTQSTLETVLLQGYKHIIPNQYHLLFHSVDLLSSVWVAGSKPHVYTIPDPCTVFSAKFNHIQEQLQDISGMDELLSGQ